MKNAKVLISGEGKKSIVKLFFENFEVLKNMVGTVEVEEPVDPNKIEELRKSIENIEKMEEKHLNFEKTIKRQTKENQRGIKVEPAKISNNKKVRNRESKNKEAEDITR